MLEAIWVWIEIHKIFTFKMYKIVVGINDYQKYNYQYEVKILGCSESIGEFF
jgi:hypothetical protein